MEGVGQMAKAKGSSTKGSSTKKASSTVSGTPTEQPEAAHAIPKSAEAPAQPVVVTEERYRLIAEAAYLRAETRGFRGGDPVVDWLEAEMEVNRRLMPQGQGGY